MLINVGHMPEHPYEYKLVPHGLFKKEEEPYNSTLLKKSTPYNPHKRQ